MMCSTGARLTRASIRLRASSAACTSPGFSGLYDFADTSDSAGDTVGALKYTAASGSYDFRDCEPGDLAQVRFSFNVTPQHQNTLLEVGLIWATRDENDAVTFRFPLLAQPIFFGTGIGTTYLNRVTLSAYFASGEDVNARALPAIRANEPVLVQPLSTLCTIVR